MPAIPSILERFPPPAPIVNQAARRRRLATWSALAVPGLAGALGAWRSWRTGAAAGGIATLALGLVRWQFARWFTDSPAYEVEARLGELEIRRYAARIEAVARADDRELEAALDRGFGRLLCYLYGANADDEDLAMSVPVVAARRDGAWRISLALPPGRPLDALPPPNDPRVELRAVPAHRIAAMSIGRRTDPDWLASRERRLLRGLIDAGRAARGSVALACFDSPSTLPALRRNELWMQLV